MLLLSLQYFLGSKNSFSFLYNRKVIQNFKNIIKIDIDANNQDKSLGYFKDLIVF